MKIKRLMMFPMLFTLCVFGDSEVNNTAYMNNYQRALEAVKQGNLERAKACFSTALVYKPGDPNAQKGLQMTEERLRNPSLQPGNNDAEVKDSALRLSIGIVPGMEKKTGHNDDYEKDDRSPDLQFEVLAVNRFGLADGSRFGGVLGGGMFVVHHTGEDEEGDSYNRSAAGLLVQAGVTARLGERLVVELVPYLGWGVTEIIIDPYVHAGIKAGAYLPVGSHELGLEVGIASFSTTIRSGKGARIAVVLSL